LIIDDENSLNNWSLKEKKKLYWKKWYSKNKQWKKEYRLKYKERDQQTKKLWRLKNKEKINKRNQKWRENNKDKVKNQHFEYYNNNKSNIKKKRKEWYELNKEKIKNYYKKYRKNNKIKIRKYFSNRLKKDYLFKLKNNLRSYIRFSLKRNGFIKNSKTLNILGCTYKEFIIYIESKFESWMSWDNYGKYNGELNYGWDIDHIIPLSNGKTEEEIYVLNHFTNLQPLCSKINRDIKKANYN